MVKKFFKKGVGVKETGGLVLSIIIFFVTLAIFVSCIPIIGKNPEGLASRTNLNELAYEIKSLLRSDENFDASLGFPLGLEDEYVIVGFDKEWDELFRNEKKAQFMDVKNNIKTECAEGWGSDLKKPVICEDKACLCLYKYDKHDKIRFGVNENIPIECRKFDGDVVFLRSKDPIDSQQRQMTPRLDVIDSYNINLEIVKEVDYPFLFLYGKYYYPNIECKRSWKVRNAYIEKFVRDDGKINLLVAVGGIKEQGDIERRYSNIKAYFEFEKFIEAYNKCNSYTLKDDESCSCGPVSLNMPEHHLIGVTNKSVMLLGGKVKEVISEKDLAIQVIQDSEADTDSEEIKLPEFTIVEPDALRQQLQDAGIEISDQFLLVIGKQAIYFTKHLDGVGIGTENPEQASCLV